jgi:Protein of unknown function (DUF3285)
MSDSPVENVIPVDNIATQSMTGTATAAIDTPPTAEELKSKFVKYAMRNMVKKGSKSLQHFALSAIGLLTLFVGLAYLTR